jgi:putative ABC transport system permease protein
MRVNRVRVVLLVLEIAVTLTIVVNCMNMIAEQRARIATPSGIDEDHIATIRTAPWSSAFADAAFVRDVVERDLATLRALPGVVDATPISAVPLQGGGSSSQAKPLGAPDTAKVRTPVYYADTHVLTALGLELIAGRAFTESDIPEGDGPRILNCLVTRDLADALFPDGNALGKTIDTGSEQYPDVIVGVVSRMHTPYGGGPMESRIIIYPGMPTFRGASQYLVRATPDAYQQVVGQLEEALTAVNAERVFTVRTLQEVKGLGYSMNRFTAGVLLVVMALLLLVTVMGIYGMASFSVTQRTKQIGTRRALGGTRSDIVAYFLIEVSAIAAMGMTLGLAGAFALNVALVNSLGGTRLPAGLVVVAAVLLWGVTLAATALPARRAAAIPPAMATRTV